MAGIGEDRADAIALAQGLMAEITGRFEDLANESAELHSSTRPAPALLGKTRSLVRLIEAHQILTEE